MHRWRTAFRDAARARGSIGPPWIGGYVDYEWRHLLGHIHLATYGFALAARQAVLEFGANDIGASAIVMSHLGAQVQAVDVRRTLARAGSAQCAAPRAHGHRLAHRQCARRPAVYRRGLRPDQLQQRAPVRLAGRPAGGATGSIVMLAQVVICWSPAPAARLFQPRRCTRAAGWSASTCRVASIGGSSVARSSAGLWPWALRADRWAATRTWMPRMEAPAPLGTPGHRRGHTILRAMGGPRTLLRIGPGLLAHNLSCALQALSEPRAAGGAAPGPPHGARDNRGTGPS